MEMSALLNREWRELIWLSPISWKCEKKFVLKNFQVLITSCWWLQLSPCKHNEGTKSQKQICNLGFARTQRLDFLCTKHSFGVCKLICHRLAPHRCCRRLFVPAVSSSPSGMMGREVAVYFQDDTTAPQLFPSVLLREILHQAPRFRIHTGCGRPM